MSTEDGVASSLGVKDAFTPPPNLSLSLKDCDLLSRLKVPTAEREPQRMRVLRETGLLDTPSEAVYDRYTAMCARYFKLPIALVSLVDVDRQWFKSRVGLGATETHRDLAFCSYTVLDRTDEVFIVRDALADPRFANNPLVTGHPDIRFYAGAGIVVGGVKIGSLCVIDTVARPSFSAADARMLKDITRMVEAVIEERRAKVLNFESDLARLSVSLLHSLRCPLHRLCREFGALQDIIRKNKISFEDQVGTVRHFQERVHQLVATLEAGRGLAQAQAAASNASRFISLRQASHAPVCSLEDITSTLKAKTSALGVLMDWRGTTAGVLGTDRSEAWGTALESLPSVRVDISLLSIVLCSTLATYGQKWKHAKLSCVFNDNKARATTLRRAPSDQTGRLREATPSLAIQVVVDEYADAMLAGHVEDAQIEESNDLILRMLTQSVCGSFEHEYIDDSSCVTDVMKIGARSAICDTPASEVVRIWLPCVCEEPMCFARDQTAQPAAQRVVVKKPAASGPPPRRTLNGWFWSWFASDKKVLPDA